MFAFKPVNRNKAYFSYFKLWNIPCPSYGCKKADGNKNQLVLDEITVPIVTYYSKKEDPILGLLNR